MRMLKFDPATQALASADRYVYPIKFCIISFAKYLYIFKTCANVNDLIYILNSKFKLKLLAIALLPAECIAYMYIYMHVHVHVN